jgi:hypothetical protein
MPVDLNPLTCEHNGSRILTKQTFRQIGEKNQLSDLETALSFGRIEADGTVLLTLPDGSTKSVGQWAAGEPAEGLNFFARKYVDLLSEVQLATSRMAQGKAQVDLSLKLIEKVKENIQNPNFIGDITALSSQMELLRVATETRSEELSKKRAEQKAFAITKRTELVEEAEKLSTSTKWKASGDRFKELVDEWKKLPHGPKAAEQELWKRLSKARSAFDKARRQFFAQRQSERAEAENVKVELIKEAKKIATSTDWPNTSNKFKNLMGKWKQAPKGTKEQENQWWAEFKGYQDTFFAGYKAQEEKTLAVENENLEKKKELAAKAEALLPVTDLASAKKALRSIQDQWDEIGHVPRKAKNQIENRLKAVEDAIRNQERGESKNSNPENTARAKSTADLLRAKLEETKAMHQAALDKADQKKAESLASTIATQEMLLAAAEKALMEFSS